MGINSFLLVEPPYNHTIVMIASNYFTPFVFALSRRPFVPQVSKNAACLYGVETIFSFKKRKETTCV